MREFWIYPRNRKIGDPDWEAAFEYPNALTAADREQIHVIEYSVYYQLKTDLEAKDAEIEKWKNDNSVCAEILKETEDMYTETLQALTESSEALKNLRADWLETRARIEKLETALQFYNLNYGGLTAQEALGKEEG